jgi:hypothetical protein
MTLSVEDCSFYTTLSDDEIESIVLDEIPYDKVLEEYLSN